MNQDEILRQFRTTGALLTGHFLLSSGLHSDQYFQCARVLQYPALAERLCAQLARPFRDEKVAAVIAPAVGGIVVAHETARALGVRAVFAEREQDEMRLRRGFELAAGERVLVVEDVVTTGGSVKEVIELVKASGATPIGVAALVDRSGGRVDFGLPFVPLVRLDVHTYPAERCKLCQAGEPLVKPGSRKRV